ncbi:MAG: hypothetical protein K6C95_11155 [Lachnospiraceae bacterium]|nr:hypothetical protein [Lachnospiraceae bacterium]
MANSVNSVNPIDQNEWEEAKQGLPDKIQGVFTKDAFFKKAQEIGFDDPKLVRAMYVIGGTEQGSIYLEMPVIGMMLDKEGEFDTPEKVLDSFCRRMDDHNRVHPLNNIGKLYPEEAGLIIDEWNYLFMDKDDYVKRYRPDEFDPWKNAMENLPSYCGGYKVDEFFYNMRKLGFDEEEDIPVISALFELSAVSKDLSILDQIKDKSPDDFIDQSDFVELILDNAEESKYRELLRTHPDQMKTLYDYYNAKNPENTRQPAYEIDPKSNMIRKAEDMNQMRRLDEKLGKTKADKPWMDDISRRSQYLLYGDHDMRTLAEMFNTKKTLRLFQGGDSTEYKNARDTLNGYINLLDDTKEFLRKNREDLDNNRITKEVYENNIRERMDDLKYSEMEVRRTMGIYAIKVTNGNAAEGVLGDKSIKDMTATGAARLAGAMCVLECLDKANMYRGDRTVEFADIYGDVRDEEHVKEISYAKLYAEKFGEIKDEKNRHRRAAAYAQQQIKEDEKQPAKDVGLGV